MASAALAALTAFHYIGFATAAWAVLLFAVGFGRQGFPGRRASERAIIAISVVLVAATIGTAVTNPEHPKRARAATPAASVPKGAAKLSLSADPSGQLRFSTRALRAKPGPVELVLSNPSPISHNVSIQGAGVNRQGPIVGHGKTSTVFASLKPGTYTFYCAVPGHRQAGMQGTLTVG